MAKVHARRIEEHHVKGRRLGRHVKHDPRSRDFVAEVAPGIVNVRHDAKGLPLLQDVGSCTAEALTGAVNSEPNLKADTAPRGQDDAMVLYGLETKNEGQPYPPNDPGGTGLEVCKAAQQLGWISSYTHAFSFKDALKALVLRPVIFGVNWYEGFDQPDENGLITISGQVRGGHEILADEIDADRELLGFWNSWGTSYGLGGRMFMAFKTVEQLLSEEGDATVPVV